jgi:type II restriction enzyme
MTLLTDAEVVLRALGIPLDQLTATRRAHAARAFIALTGLKPGDSWSQAQDMTSRTLTTKQILKFGRDHYGETRSNGTYDNVRRQDLLLPVASGVVQAAANNATANTNDATRGYGIHPEAAQVARSFGTDRWTAACAAFDAAWPSRAKQLAGTRELKKNKIRISEDLVLTFEPDLHNQLQKAIVEEFLPRFGHGADLLYVGDAADKGKFNDHARLQELGVFSLGHDKLPDVVAYSSAKNWLFLIEAVTTANPVSEIRRLTLERLLEKTCKADRVYVSAFPDRATFRKFAADIAWETEVWVADAPEHMVHFNGDKFLGPHVAAAD